MARHRSPFDEEIAHEWERLVFGVGYGRPDPGEREPPPEQVEGWRRLHEKTYRDGAWLCGPDDAGLVAMLGIKIAMQQRLYADGVRLSREFLAHPGLPSRNTNTEDFEVRLGLALILIARIDEGIAILDRVLAKGGYPRATRRHIVRNELFSALHDLGEENPPDPRLADFVARLFSDWPGQKRKAARARGALTHAALIHLLETTYPT